MIMNNIPALDSGLGGVGLGGVGVGGVGVGGVDVGDVDVGDVGVGGCAIFLPLLAGFLTARL